MLQLLKVEGLGAVVFECWPEASAASRITHRVLLALDTQRPAASHWMFIVFYATYKKQHRREGQGV
jgi:hypothetical protein